jgi:uncharacterized protein (DUF2267 family)
MDELVNRVAERAGISQDQAREAVNTVIEFIKEKLPPAFAGQVDNFINGGKIGGLGGFMGGMFGKKG